MKIIHGAARGADRMADSWANAHGIEVVVCPAWDRQGKAAGPIRNDEMLVRHRPTRVMQSIVRYPQGRP
jgi:hypothetical protein